MHWTASEVAGIVNGTVVGDGNVVISGLNGIKEARDGELTFLGDSRYLPFLETTGASVILVSKDVSHSNGATLIQVDSPYLAFAQVLSSVEPHMRRRPTGVHPTAHIGEGVELGNGVSIGPYAVIEDGTIVGDNAVIYGTAFIGAECRIGAGTIVYARVAIRERVQIGAGCIIHCGAVVGSDGFGFTPGAGGAFKIPQIGIVVVEDEVEIGANTTIDRATCGETVIGKGTKIDNLVQIGHNARIGEGCLISGHVGIAGSATIGNGVVIGGQAGVGGHIEVGDNVMIAGRAGATKSVKAGGVVMGFPAEDANKHRRILAGQRRVPGLLREIGELKKRLAALEKQRDGKTADDS